MNGIDIQAIFFDECEESLQAAEAGLDACKAGTQDSETINAIFRAVHSIKGGAGAFGYEALASYTHVFENLLGDVREGTVPVTSDLVDMLLLALDSLRDHVEAVRGGTAAPDDAAIKARLAEAHENVGKGGDTVAAAPAPAAAPAAVDMDDLDALLDDLLGPDPAPAASEARAEDSAGQAEDWALYVCPQAGAMDNGSEPLLWLRELVELGGACVKCDESVLPQIDELDPNEGYLAWTFTMPGSVEREKVADIFDFVGEQCLVLYGAEALNPPARARRVAAPEAKAPPAATAATATVSTKPAAAAPTPAPAAPAAQSIRIDLGKLDQLIDGVGELVIAQAMLAQRLSNEGLAHFEELAMLEGLVRDIQERAMAFRAQPISSVFSRVPRLLRELATSTGKHVKLVVAGETTELDKTVIERLSEPLTHLIRNAVDHGIESPEDRRAAGKDAEGTLTLSAEQRAGRIVIRIGDDGAGINREKVLAKAIEKGIVDPELHNLSDEEIDNLIFAPGFSTAAQVSSISGRGVGMDVVRQNVKELGGRITIESRPGQGTDFVLALPLTLAISDGMIVQVGDQSLVIPLTHVVESLSPTETEIKGMGRNIRMLNVRGQFLPIVPLRQLTGGTSPEEGLEQGVLVVVETERCGQAALLVDAIIDQRQFVIKSLDTHYRSVDGVAGATILGNGRVALIVDVDRLVLDLSKRPHAAAEAA
ncbi:chemotaxis protein CheA [Aurantiacibacter xanthus]|uniref:Chemotaxis protein CheA n=1 Tax=Aurantiacibacter xanthus TaxID=1784712 RepID=A0A3A1PGD6_9SPHN|nr:chemotaxis protein CheA [Aurantiacibacter xanthus]RIV92878.1 chemotaxis protein CheA [Aurantiacibacter xanthus]